jgi:hypothetical protein
MITAKTGVKFRRRRVSPAFVIFSPMYCKTCDRKGPVNPAASNTFQFALTDAKEVLSSRGSLTSRRRKGQASVYLSATNIIGVNSSKIILARIREEAQAIVVIIIANHASGRFLILTPQIEL